MTELNSRNTITVKLPNKVNNLLVWSILIRLRDNFQCRVCKADGVLHAHHISNAPSLELVIRNGITLCEKHHRQVHHSRTFDLTPYIEQDTISYIDNLNPLIKPKVTPTRNNTQPPYQPKQQNNVMPPLLTIKDVAKLLHVDNKTISQLINNGKIKVVHIGSRIRINQKDLFLYIKNNTLKITKKEQDMLNLVQIYEDPITRNKLEGWAYLLDFVLADNQLEYWKVKFKDSGEIVYRWILKNHALEGLK